MIELSNEYLNLLAEQMIFICSFLGGFAATILGTLISSDVDNRCSRAMVVSTAFTSLCFVVCLLAMTTIYLYTSDGFPVEIQKTNFAMARIVGVTTFGLGLVTFCRQYRLFRLAGFKVSWHHYQCLGNARPGNCSCDDYRSWLTRHGMIVRIARGLLRKLRFRILDDKIKLVIFRFNNRIEPRRFEPFVFWVKF